MVKFFTFSSGVLLLVCSILFVSSIIAAPQPTAALAYQFTIDLQPGDVHPEVKLLQQFLNGAGYTVAATGPGAVGEETTYFGPATEVALKQYQLSVGINPTGVLGPLTRQAILESAHRQPRSLEGERVFPLTVVSVSPQAPIPEASNQAPTLNISASPQSVSSGSSATISWTSTNATWCTGSWTSPGTSESLLPTSGSYITPPLTTNTEFKVNCSGPGVSLTRAVTVAVNSTPTVPSPNVTLFALPETITAGGTTRLTWSSTNATSCTASWGSVGLSGSWNTPNLNNHTNYTITCTGAGGSRSATVSVVVSPAPVPAPTVTLSASPTTVNAGGTTRLTWSSTNAEECAASWDASTLSGTFTTWPLTQTTEFRITCYGPGGSRTTSVTVTVNQPAPAPVPVVTLTANPTTIVQGEKSNLTWSSTNATSCTGSWSGANSSVALNGSFQTPSLNNTTTYTVTCSGSGGTVSKSATVTVNAPTPPPPTPAPTVTLSASPTTITAGATTRLTWSSTNATSCTASWGSVGLSGSWTSPALNLTTTYTITCTGAGGSKSASATVTVNTPTPPPNAPAPTVTLSASPTTINVGETTTLTWSSANAQECTGSWDGNALQGQFTTWPLEETQTFTMSCYGANNSRVSAQVTITVIDPNPRPTVTLSANPTTVVEGNTTTLTWSATNATSCNGSWGNVALSGTWTSPALTQNTNYTLTCTGPGGSNSASVNIIVTSSSPLPTVTIMAVPNSIPYLGSTTIYWTSENATSCTPNWVPWTVPLNGNYSPLPLLRTQDFSMRCTGPGGTRTVFTRVVVDSPPQPPTNQATIFSKDLDMSRLLLLRAHHESSRYERFQRLQVLKGDSALVPFMAFNFTTGGTEQRFLQDTYRLRVDGVERATTVVSATSTRGSFVLDLRPISEGWHLFEVVGHPTEVGAPYYMYVQKSDRPAPSTSMGFSVGTHGLMFAYGGSRHMWGTVPAVFSPTILRLAPRETPAFTEALRGNELVTTQIAPVRSDDVHRPNVNNEGLMNTFNTQAYFWSDFVRKFPRVPLLDGPRGLGTVAMPTHIQVGRNAYYVTDPWRLMKIDEDGTVRTLVGYRHRTPPSYYAGTQDLELVGDWSAIPQERRGMHEIWGFTWDIFSLAIDPNGPIVNGEPVHLNPPRAFIADTQNNRVLLLTFDRASHDTPPKVTEFITGLSDPWDVVWVNGVLYVSERTGHRISAYDANSGQFIRNLVSGPDYSGVSTSRFVFRRTSLDLIRQQDVVGPEGLFHQDGWIYYGSLAMAQVKRVNIATGEVQLVVNAPTDGNSTFIKITLSDGTFGPRGTLFMSHWSNARHGYPHVFLPDGTPWNILGNGEFNKGAPNTGMGYATAVGVGRGRMLAGAVSEGLVMLSKTLPTDATFDLTRYRRGHDEYVTRGFRLIYGHGGFGFYGLPLPWGVSPDVDYYLTLNGHVRP